MWPLKFQFTIAEQFYYLYLGSHPFSIPVITSFYTSNCM